MSFRSCAITPDTRFLPKQPIDNIFHVDNDSEYTNHQVTTLLNKLHIHELTKSGPRRSNDNALVENKNANVVRHDLGYAHIPPALHPAGQCLHPTYPIAGRRLTTPQRTA